MGEVDCFRSHYALPITHYGIERHPPFAMSKDPSELKRCPECGRTVPAAGMRPLARTRYGGGIRFACPACFARVMEFRKAVAARKRS